MADNASTAPVQAINQAFEEREAQKLAKDLGLSYIDLVHYPLNPEVLKLLPESAAQKAQTVPFFRSGYKVKLATTQPEGIHLVKVIEAFEEKDFEVEIEVCSQTSLNAILPLYESDLINKKTVEKTEDFDERENQTFEQQFLELGHLDEKLKSLPAEKALNEIEIVAIQLKASDIHIQPYEDRAVLRFRINGILHNISDLDLGKAKKMVSRIKYESGMKSNISNIPQDGHMSFVANDRSVDLRVSTLPTEFFESVVMRVLDSRKGIKNFEELGFHRTIKERIESALRHKNGMILVTGPTGSGKTTTLYSMLSTLNDSEKKLVTLEDPIEYHLDNVTQSQVNENSDYNFSNGLKALLRHDPDVILIGEIREFNTAHLSSEASLTGHIVLSSLHTNSALGAVTRLRNLGLESYNVAASVNAIIAQRLLRRVCPHCATTMKLDLNNNPEVKSAIARLQGGYREVQMALAQKGLDPVKETQNNDALVLEVPVSRGCEHCSHTGYIGQTVICEMVDFTENLRTAISENKTEIECFQLAREEHPEFITLFEDGVRKVILGETTLDEVYRVAG